MATLRIGWALWMAAIRGELQYRFNFVIWVVMAMIFQGTGFIFIWVVLSRFQAVGGWGLGEVAFLYGLRLLMHGFTGFFSGAFFTLQWLVRDGAFDRYLVRPLSPLVQLISQFPPSGALGDSLGGIILFVAAASLVPISWTPLAILYLVLAVLGGSLVEFAIRMLCASLVFRFLAGNAPMRLIDMVFSNFGNYPLAIFGGVLQFMLTFVLPLAFLAYFPAVVLLGRTSELQVSPYFAYGAPLVGVAWFVLAFCVFQRELRFYQSAGH